MSLTTEAKALALGEVYREYQDNSNLSKLRASATNFVGGQGALDAPVLLLGEAPGKREDADGLPFVGDAGEVLNLLIKRAGLKRNELFITNVVKYRPIDANNQDRRPTAFEVNQSRKCLAREIEIVGPEVVALMGRTAIQTYFPFNYPTRDHGTVYRQDKQSRPIVFLYHPAMAAYNNEMVQTLIDDFKVITTALKESRA